MEKRTTDIVVIGSGAAGLGAAIAAAEKGAKVTVLEKRKMIGGISVTGMGIFAVESRLQRLKNHPLTKQEAFHFFMNRSHWKPDARLVSKFINRSADTIDWLENMGVQFELLDINWGIDTFNQVGHIVVTPEGFKLRGGVSNFMIKAMYERACELGVEVLLNIELKDIIKENGCIRGIIAENADGTEIEFDSKAVVVATGGYVHNPEIMMKYTGRTLNKDFFIMHNIPLDGKGIQLAWKAGAVSDNMSLQQAGYIAGIDYRQYPNAKKISFSYYLTNVVESPQLYVNIKGQRFMDESLMNKAYTASAIARQKNHTAYAILDENAAKRLETYGIQDVGYMERKIYTLPNVTEIIEKNAAENTPYVVAADSIEELAQKCGIDKENLKATIDEYNSYCQKGYDDQFGKEYKWLKPVNSGRYYALLMRVDGYGTFGGIKIDDLCEALDNEDNAIPGLYAAGDCANSLMTYYYAAAFSLWGSSLSFAVNSGRFAGESAADYIATVND